MNGRSWSENRQSYDKDMHIPRMTSDQGPLARRTCRDRVAPQIIAMAKQTKPFIVEIKQFRKLKPSAPKPSIWGKLDLSTTEDLAPADTLTEPSTTESGDRL
ncbi:hypothetical protein A4U53_003800 (plasmid) [Rhizobium ruizarguesonis]|uniref:Uncharacterized protein n=1 Tax=Rhizobium ruizarguesonis TaxID=2081791 RepID=A0ACD5EGE7_9HYPH